MTELEDNKPVISSDAAAATEAPEADFPAFEIIDLEPKKERVVHLGKWLWAARFFTTKELAISAIKSGAVTYNYDSAHHNQEIYIGDVITVKYGKNTKTIQVTGLSTRRRNRTDAGLLYKEEYNKASSQQRHSNKRKRSPYQNINEPKHKKHHTNTNKPSTTATEEPNYNREHSQQQFPSDFASQHFLDRAQKWYDEPDSRDQDD